MVWKLILNQHIWNDYKFHFANNSIKVTFIYLEEILENVINFVISNNYVSIEGLK